VARKQSTITASPEPLEPSPAAKASHCGRCDARYVPRHGCLFCDACVESETKRRVAQSGYTKCRVIGNVCAVGRLDDGFFRSNFADGEIAEFADEDVLSLPDTFVPLSA
jgi:hypothetical protein